MRPKLFLLVLLLGAATAGILTYSAAQPPQIPTTQIPNQTLAEEQKVTVGITSRSDATHAGKFVVRLKLKYDPAVDAYPVGAVEIDVDLSDALKCQVTATTIEQVTSTGKHTPTVILSGRCDVRSRDPDQPQPPSGCRYWLLLADNTKELTSDHTKNTPDIVSFFVEDKAGKRVAYGTGTVVVGNIILAPTPN